MEKQNNNGTFEAVVFIYLFFILLLIGVGVLILGICLAIKETDYYSTTLIVIGIGLVVISIKHIILGKKILKEAEDYDMEQNRNRTFK